MSSGRLLGICGSLRAASFNRKLMLEAGVSSIRRSSPTRTCACRFMTATWRTPTASRRRCRTLADQIAAADAVIIAGPEYNKALSGVLKNALDWVSRTKGKPVARQARGDPVGRGGARGRGADAELAAALHGAVPRPCPAGAGGLVGQASGQFDADGRLTNERGWPRWRS
jgi:chromate reductase